MKHLAWLLPCLVAGCGSLNESAHSVRLPTPIAELHVRPPDANPRHYAGRYVPADLPARAISETQAIKTECSQFFDVTRIEAAGHFEQVMTASQAAAAGLGLPRLGIDTSDRLQRLVLVEYELTGKLRADISDPAGYAACCAAADGQCHSRVIGEYLEGTGRIMSVVSERSRQTSGARGIGGLEVRNGVYWREVTRWARPMYFAFRLSRAPTPAPIDWPNARQELPKPRGAHAFEGVSEWLDSERLARQMAARDVVDQVVQRFGGVDRVLSGTDATRVEGAGGDLATHLQARSQGTWKAQGKVYGARMIKWHVDRDRQPRGWRYKVRVLAFVSERDSQRVARDR